MNRLFLAGLAPVAACAATCLQVKDLNDLPPDLRRRWRVAEFECRALCDALVRLAKSPA